MIVPPASLSNLANSSTRTWACSVSTLISSPFGPKLIRKGTFLSERHRTRGASRFSSGVLERFLNKSSTPELVYSPGDIFAVRLQREVPGVEEADHRKRNIAFERLGTGWQEERVVLAPHCQKRRLVRAEVFLK